MVGWVLVGAIILAKGATPQFQYQVNDTTKEPVVFHSKEACERAQEIVNTTFKADQDIAFFELHCVTFEYAKSHYFPDDFGLKYEKQREV